LDCIAQGGQGKKGSHVDGAKLLIVLLKKNFTAGNTSQRSRRCGGALGRSGPWSKGALVEYYRNDISRKSSNVKIKHQQCLQFNIASQASDLIKKLIKRELG
jgi:hypothetical protein